MVRKKGSLILCGAILFVAWNALLLLFLWGRPPIGRLGEAGGVEPGAQDEWRGVKVEKGAALGGGGLAGEVIRLAEEVETELETQKKLLKQIQNHRSLWQQQKDEGGKATPVPARTSPTDLDRASRRLDVPEVTSVPDDKQNEEVGPQTVIPILVIACDRVTVKRSLDKLIQYRPSVELHPIIVSQDCGHAETARVIGSYGSQVTHISQPDLANIPVRPDHRKFQGYYKIARHYRWALNQVFNTFGYSTVVIVEDDLEVRVTSLTAAVTS